MPTIARFASMCRHAEISILATALRHIYYRLAGKNIVAANLVKVHGLANIAVTGLLRVGLGFVGFMDNRDRTLLRIRGRLSVNGDFSIGRGCRVDVGPNASVTIHSGYIGPNTKVIIMHGLQIGEQCAISWDCQIIDDDFHVIQHPGAEYADRRGNITIGSRVWIGSRVTVLRGSRIPNGCVVGAGSLVNREFTEENCLIAGVPAKVLKRNVHWH